MESRNPKIRFKGFDKEWEEVKLGNIAEFFNGRRIPIESEIRVKGQYPYYGASGIIDYVEGYIFDGEYVLLAEDGANIIMRNSPIAYLTKGKFWVNNHAHIMSMKKGSNIFLAQILENKSYEKFNSGTAQPKLNSQVVKNITFNVPLEDEQIKIGEFFKQLDSIISLHQQELDTLKQTKRGFMQKMFPKEGEFVPKVRFSGFTGEWKKYSLKDLAKIRTGKAFESTDFIDDGEYMVVTNKNILDQTNGIVSRGTRINISDQNVLKKYVLSGENILVTMDGVNIGVTGKYSNDKAVLAQRVGRLNSKQIEFIYQVTKSSRFIAEMNKLSVGNAIKHISLNQISNYSFMAPASEEEQEIIGEFFKKIDRTIALQQQELDALKQTKKAFLQKMFV